MNFPRLPLLLLTTLLLLTPSHGAIYTESMLSNSTPKVEEFQKQIKYLFDEAEKEAKSNNKQILNNNRTDFCFFLGNSLSLEDVDNQLYKWLTIGKDQECLPVGKDAVLAFFLIEDIKKEINDYGIKVDDLITANNERYDTKDFDIYLSSQYNWGNGQSATSVFGSTDESKWPNGKVDDNYETSALFVFTDRCQPLQETDYKAMLAHEMGHQLIFQSYPYLIDSKNYVSYVVHESLATYIKYLYYCQILKRPIVMTDFIRSCIVMDDSNMICQYQPAPYGGNYKVSIPYMAAFVSTLDIKSNKVRPDTDMLKTASDWLKRSGNLDNLYVLKSKEQKTIEGYKKISNINASQINKQDFISLITSAEFATYLQKTYSANIFGYVKYHWDRRFNNPIDAFINNLQ